MKRATLFLSKIGSCSLEQRVCDDHMNELLSESFSSLGENAILMGSALLKGMKARVKTSQEGSLFCILSIRVRNQRRWLVLDQLWHRNWSSSKASGKFSACWKYLPNTGSLPIVIPTLEIVNLSANHKAIHRLQLYLDIHPSCTTVTELPRTSR